MVGMAPKLNPHGCAAVPLAIHPAVRDSATSYPRSTTHYASPSNSQTLATSVLITHRCPRTQLHSCRWLAKNVSMTRRRRATVRRGSQGPQPSLPPECQQIAEKVAALLALEEDKCNAIGTLDGAKKWKAIQDLGTLRQQLADQQALLDECEKRHLADLVTKVVVIDVPNASGPDRVARLWQVTPTGLAVKQTATVQAGVATFSGVPGDARQSLAMTIEETNDPVVNGPDFRSGPLPPAPTASPDPAGRVEIVLLDPIVVAAKSLEHAVPPLPLELSLSSPAVGVIKIAVAELKFGTDTGAMIFSASGTASALGISSGFELEGNLHVAPSFEMAPSALLEISAADPPSLTMSGMVGAVVQDVSNFLSANLIAPIIQPVTTLLNAAILKEVSAALGLSVLPSGTVVSIRQLTLDADNITLAPSLAGFGTRLSDFQPSALVAAPQLIGLDLEPTSISTSDPANRVARGKVTLSEQAQAGGVNIVLSCDQPDVTQVDPPVLAVEEGAVEGVFTITGLEQALIQASHVDGTVSASFGSQTLTAPITIRPEAPVTPVSSSSPSLVIPETQQLEQDILVLVNQHRTTLQLPVLISNDTCVAEARSHSFDMASGRVPLGHDGFEERISRIDAATNRSGGAENTAAGFKTATEVVQAWLSQGNYATAIEGPYALTGVGVARAGDGTSFFTHIFV